MKKRQRMTVVQARRLDRARLLRQFPEDMPTPEIEQVLRTAQQAIKELELLVYGEPEDIPYG